MAIDENDLLQKRYVVLKDGKWRTEGFLIFFSILTLVSYIGLAANVAGLILLSANVDSLPAVFVMIVLLFLFAYRQYRLTFYNPKIDKVPALQKSLTPVNKIGTWLSKLTFFLYGFAAVVLAYLYVTITSSRSPSKLPFVYASCVAGVFVYLAGMLIITWLGGLRERIMAHEAARGD